MRTFKTKLFLIATICMMFLLLACSSPTRIPNGVIAEKQMAQILTECQLAEAYITSQYPNDTEMRQKSTQAIYTEIFKKHNITAEEFKRSYTYYIENLWEMKGVFESVVNQLNAQ